MEPHSHLNASSEARQVLQGQLRECYGRVVYSHKTHEKCADILLRRLSMIKWCQIVLSAVLTGGFISAFFGDARGSMVGAIVSALLLALNIYTKDYDLGDLAQKHKQAANNIWCIREKYLSLITDLEIGEKPLDALQKERDVLTDDLHSVYSDAPITMPQAYRKAQKALKQNEDMTFSDEEIDAFLPKELKKANNHNVISDIKR